MRDTWSIAVVLGLVWSVGLVGEATASEMDERANSAVFLFGGSPEFTQGTNSASASQNDDSFRGQGSATAGNRNLGAAAAAQNGYVYSNAQWQEVLSIKNTQGGQLPANARLNFRVDGNLGIPKQSNNESASFDFFASAWSRNPSSPLEPPHGFARRWRR